MSKKLISTISSIYLSSGLFILTAGKAFADINLGEIEGPGEFQRTEGSASVAAENYVSVIVGALTAIAGIAFLLYFIISAFNWITSGGDKAKTTQAKDGMTHAAIGLIAVVVSYFIASIIGTVLGIDFLTPSSFLDR